MTIQKSFCRFCHALCGIDVDVVDGRVVKVLGDRENAISEGFTCLKGRALPEQLYDSKRVLESVAKDASGEFRPIENETAMDEIADRVARSVADHGPRSVGIYVGTATYQNSVALPFLRCWMAGLGSPSFYTSLSIDQPNKIIAPQLHGSFMSGTQSFATSDVWMIFGCNPPVSMYGGTTGFPSFNPTKALREARKRGLDLIVVDPRTTELAKDASLHLPVRPGEDAALIAGMLRVIIDEELYDADFCDRFVSGIAELREGLEPCDAEFVERRTGLAFSLVREAARRFAAGPRGLASSGTGPSMAPNPNLTELLIMCLNSLCGRFNRAGESIDNPGVLAPPRTFVEQAMSPYPGFRMEPQSRIRGLGQVAGELPTSALPEEILTPGEGQLRILFVVGGNPLLSWPDQLKTRDALDALDLLVVLDPRMTATARFADYVIAPAMSLERPDVTGLMDSWYPRPYSMYTPPVVEKPDGVIDEWEFFWGLAKRLGTGIPLPGGAVEMDTKPTTDDILANITSYARVPLDEIKRHASGAIFAAPDAVVAAGDPESRGRLQVAPEEALAELAAICAEPPVDGAGYRPGEQFSHRLISRRLREVFNSMGQELEVLRAKRPYNPAFVNPGDLADIGVDSGQLVEIASQHGRVLAVAEAAEDIPPGVVSMAHAWGDLPEFDPQVRKVGSSANRLVDASVDFDPISGIGRQSAIPVNITSAEP